MLSESDASQPKMHAENDSALLHDTFPQLEKYLAPFKHDTRKIVTRFSFLTIGSQHNGIIHNENIHNALTQNGINHIGIIHDA